MKKPPHNPASPQDQHRVYDGPAPSGGSSVTPHQERRIEQALADFVEGLLTGGGCIEIRPLTPDATVADILGSVTVLNGFTIRLRKDA